MQAHEVKAKSAEATRLQTLLKQAHARAAHNNADSHARAALLSGLERENRESLDRLAGVTRERDAAKHIAERRADGITQREKALKLLENQV
jgi:hypothetical protein